MSTEIKNLVHLIATIAIQDTDDFIFTGAAGVRELIRDDVGEFTLVPEVLLANTVPLSLDGSLPNYRSIPFVNYLAGVDVGSVRALPVPINVPAGPGSIPGTIKLFVTDALGAPADFGFFSIVVLDLPTQS